jgi:hypothetical protein
MPNVSRKNRKERKEGTAVTAERTAVREARLADRRDRMASDFASIFARLRAILQKHARGLSVTYDGPGRYCLEGRVGPATLRAWGGKLTRPLVPLAWVEIGKSGVSYHLMGVHGSPKLRDRMSTELKARMQGKACFNFRTDDQMALLGELEQLTAQAVAAFEAAGFISDRTPD